MQRLILVGILATAGAVSILASSEPDVDETKCCFTHPSYRGTCEVSPGEEESCQDVLEYLNTPNSQGKTYCGGTNLRGGWELATCEEP